MSHSKGTSRVLVIIIVIFISRGREDAVTDWRFQARTQVIDPVTIQLRSLLDTLSKNFLLIHYCYAQADLIRAKREWALEKVGELSSSVVDLKTRIEKEAKQYSTKPEELLMKSIRTTSAQLRDNLQALKEKQVFGDGTRVDSAIAYLQDLDKNLGESEDIYQVRDESAKPVQMGFAVNEVCECPLIWMNNNRIGDIRGSAAPFRGGGMDEQPAGT
ncbi:hypothetical protein OSTOST_05868 [Ostertagia ostertagi]